MINIEKIKRDLEAIENMREILNEKNTPRSLSIFSSFEIFDKHAKKIIENGHEMDASEIHSETYLEDIKIENIEKDYKYIIESIDNKLFDDLDIIKHYIEKETNIKMDTNEYGLIYEKDNKFIEISKIDEVFYFENTNGLIISGGYKGHIPHSLSCDFMSIFLGVEFVKSLIEEYKIQ